MDKPEPYDGVDRPTYHVRQPIDCYLRALPDEPRFTLLARDPDFQLLVSMWADIRKRRIDCGDAPISDLQFVEDARSIAKDGAMWRRKNNGLWRQTL